MYGLTPSEWAVMRLVAQGLSSKEIALKRKNSARTIDNHINSVLRKVGENTRILACQKLELISVSTDN